MLTSINSLSHDDLPALSEMLHAMADELGDAPIKSNEDSLMKALFAEKAILHALVAKADDEAIGFALFYPQYSTWYGAAGVYLLDIWVHPSRRGEGISKALIIACINKAYKEWDAQFMGLATHAHNDHAKAIYEKLGFMSQTFRPMFLSGENFLSYIGDENAAQ